MTIFLIRFVNLLHKNISTLLYQSKLVMKKKLEAELISIAHRVLKIHNREEVIQLQKEALNLYEKLSILRFYEEHFEPSQPTIGKTALETAIENKADFDIVIQKNNIEIIEEIKTETTTAVPQSVENTETVSQIVATEPVLEQNIDITSVIEETKTEEVVLEEKLEEVTTDEVQITFEELEANGLVQNPSEPLSLQILDEIENEEKAVETVNEQSNQKVTKATRTESEQEAFNYLNNLFSGIDDSFSTPTAKKEESVQSTFENIIGQRFQEIDFVKAEDATSKKEEKPKKEKVKKEKKDQSVSEMYSNTITLGLNDRIAFQMHLFNDSDQDLNRVISQLNTMNNIDEAHDFIANMVKPDYNNWQGKEEFENRFMILVEKRFS
nr:hypothetical protein [uncultured Flavobacterium sp.]